MIIGEILAKKERGVLNKDIAVLFRAAYHAQALEFEFVKKGIPYEYRGGMKFFERAHLKDVMAHARMVVNPKDEAAWRRVLLLQPGIGQGAANDIMKSLLPEPVDGLFAPSTLRDSSGQASSGNSRFDFYKEVETKKEMKVPPRAKRGWDILQSTLRTLASHIENPASFVRTLAAGAYREYILAEYTDGLDRLEDIEQLARFAEAYTDMPSFLADVALAQDVLEQDAQEIKDRVILSTIHQAKGLEWNTVFVMHLVEGRFPNERAGVTDEEIEEERRLFYVAATRARNELILSVPQVFDPASSSTLSTSRFVHEIPVSLLEKKSSHHSFDPPRKKTSVSRFDDVDDERIIVWDEAGDEVKKKPIPPREFLRRF